MFSALAVCILLIDGIIVYVICTFAHSLFSFALVHTVVLLESHFTGAILPTPCFCRIAVPVALLAVQTVFVPHSTLWCYEHHTSLLDMEREVGEGDRFSEI